METLLAAIELVFQPNILLVILCSCVYGLMAGSMPGISATVAVALMVPITFFMSDVAALAAITTAVAMAIFAGDLPGALLRIPGTPASAAYAEEANEMTRKGMGATVLTISLFCSVLGGIIGTLALTLSAPALARLSLQFQYYEYFWLAVIGLSMAALVSAGNPLKGLISLCLGLVLSTVGLDMISGAPRYTFGTVTLMEGVHFIPVMIGMFAVAEVMRALTRPTGGNPAQIRRQIVDYPYVWSSIRAYRGKVAVGGVIGTIIGAIPGAGSDIAAWVSYGLSKRFSKTPEKFGKGHPEGIVMASSSNNAATCSTWIPSLVFGIPGDSVTAIVIGVLFLKGLEPGPTVFVENAPLVYSIFVSFFIANVLLIFVGMGAIKLSKQLLRVPTGVLMPVIMLFSIVGAFAINNSTFGIVTAVVAGIVAFFMQENDYPVAPAILGLVLGSLLENNFMQAMIAQRGDLTAFFGRPIAASLGVIVILLWLAPLAAFVIQKIRGTAARSGGMSPKTTNE